MSKHATSESSSHHKPDYYTITKLPTPPYNLCIFNDLFNISDNIKSKNGSWVSSVSICDGMDDQGFESRHGLGTFPSPKCPDRLWGPPSLLCAVYRRACPEAKRPERESYHSSRYIAEVKNEWSHKSAPST